jgi:hypothetical protein
MFKATTVLIFILAAIGSLAVVAAGAAPSARAVQHASAGAPAVTCDFTTLNFSLSGVGTVGASRPVSITAGDSFEQFIAPPITATSTSSAFLIVNNDYSGTLTGGITGTFSISNLNGLAVTNPEGLATPRGFQLNDIVLHGPAGTITAVVAINFVAFSTNPPFMPRGFNGYLHSVATSGAYAPYKYNGAIAGTMFQTGGNAGITATVIGRLYSGGGALSEFVTGVRSVPPNRATSFQPTDMIAQFHLPDFAVGAATTGRFTPRSALAGTTTGTIDGGFVMDHDALLVDGGPNANKGWFGGEYTFSNTSGEILTGPWLADLSGSGGNTVNGYVWQVLGTGVYTDSLLFGAVNGAFLFGGSTFTGTMSGTYCEGSQIPTPSATRTTTPPPGSTNTSTPSVTATTAPSLTATATSSPILTITPSPILTLPPTASSTGTPQPTGTGAATDTSTPTVPPTAPPTITVTYTTTPCAITFSDVHPSDYFYQAVTYLYCHGVISGYSDGTFRPYNDTTRGQLSKIVVFAEGWTLDCPAPGHFIDVLPTDPFFCYIETAYNHNIISGYSDGTFRPGNNVTRGQLCKIVVLAEDWVIDPSGGPHFTDVAPDHPFYGYIETAFNHGIISGYADNTFRPGNSATRGQICKIVYEAITAP